MSQQPPPMPLRPLQYAVPPPPKNSHHQVFTGLLIALAFLMLLVIGQFTIMRAGGLLQIGWVFYYIIFIHSLYLLSIILALVVRWRVPRMRRAMTIGVSIILLFAFPFGTIVGIYGLWKVDREPRTEVSSITQTTSPPPAASPPFPP